MKFFVIRSYLIILIGLSHFVHTSAQSYFMSGAREAGMANSVITLGGTNSVYHNPAGIVSSKNISIGISYENRYLLKEISTQSLAGILPIGNGGFGTSYSYFGTSTYNEQKIALGYAHSLGQKFSAGIMMDLNTSNLPGEYKSDHAIAGNIGIIAHPVNKLSIGMHINNVTNSEYTSYSDQEPEMFFRSGLTWNEESFLIGTQVTLSKHNNPVISAGAEVTLAKSFDIRLGVSSEEQTNFTLGLGYKQNRWRGDIAFARHPTLGYSTFITAEFYLGKLNK